MKLKIAIPTSDKISISQNFLTPEFFKIITVGCGKIMEESFVQNKYLETFKNNRRECINGIMDLLKDCNYLLSINCNEEVIKYFKDRKIIMVPTSEKIVSNAVFFFISEMAQKESDTCCCP
jgi:predicted Fe-Mo cluster-binding NifX family protein